VFGSDSFRFAAMMGTFVALYKFLLNSLPLIPPHLLLPIMRSRPQRRLALVPTQAVTPASPGSPDGFSESMLLMKSSKVELETGRIRVRDGVVAVVDDETNEHETVFIRGKTERWHALVAGGVAGLAVAFEKKGRRVTIAQQLFVR